MGAIMSWSVKMMGERLWADFIMKVRVLCGIGCRATVGIGGLVIEWGLVTILDGVRLSAIDFGLIYIHSYRAHFIIFHHFFISIALNAYFPDSHSTQSPQAKSLSRQLPYQRQRFSFPLSQSSHSAQ
jgi:hypothetical protein